jgi:hypothetical protein
MRDSNIFFSHKRIDKVFYYEGTLPFSLKSFLDLWNGGWNKTKCKVCEKKGLQFLMRLKPYKLDNGIWLIGICSKECGNLFVLRNIGDKNERIGKL